MTPGADVQAIDLLQDWHTALCVHRDEALEALSSIAREIRRAFDWIDEEAQAWRREAKVAQDDIVQAKAELNQRKNPDYSGRIPDTSVQEKALARAKARLEHAEAQIDVCRQWAARLPKMISEEYDGASRRLTNFLDIEVATAIADLSARIDRLHAYLAVTPASVAPPAPSPESKS